MNKNIIVRITNMVGMASIILLIYWVFTFISIEVFGFKVFKENLTESFYMSILGILALMAGALMMNVMMNLTRIAEKFNTESAPRTTKTSKRQLLLFLLSFPLLFLLLYVGDVLSAKKKEAYLTAAAGKVIADYKVQVTELTEYKFNKQYLKKASEILELLSATEEKFPEILVIVPDTVSSAKVFLGITQRYYVANDTTTPDKKDFIFASSKEEKEYLSEVFRSNVSKPRFSKHNSKIELYYPYAYNGRMIVLYFTDYQRYGKFGS